MNLCQPGLVTPGLQSQLLGELMQELHKFDACLGNLVSLYLKTRKKKSKRFQESNAAVAHLPSYAQLL